MKTCYIYTRTAAISSGDAAKKHRSSAMTKQIAACQNYAKKHNYKVLEILEDVDSGNNFNRKGLQKLLTSCKQKSVDAVVILKIDRLSRKVADYAKIR